MKSSVQKVRESLPESKRSDFDEAMKVLAFSKIDMKDLFTQGATGVGNLEGKVKESLNGKTGVLGDPQDKPRGSLFIVWAASGACIQ
jgi:hypothetical protein